MDALTFLAATGSPVAGGSNLRNYFTSHPNEYYDLRGILSPIGDTEGPIQCDGAAAESGVRLPRIHGRLI